jgi:hypothetical protein
MRTSSLDRNVAMNRVKDHIQFAVCFTGLGYVALWPLTAHTGAIAAFEADLICGGRFLTEAICRVAPMMTLSSGLHLLGLLSAVAVVLRYAAQRLVRFRRVAAPAAVALAVSPARVAAMLKLRMPKVRASGVKLRPVKPRREFGLRGLPH